MIPCDIPNCGREATYFGKRADPDDAKPMYFCHECLGQTPKVFRTRFFRFEPFDWDANQIIDANPDV